MPGVGRGQGAVLDRALTELSYSTNTANALIHLYRAEVGKMTAYRQRLDTTTNWAVVTTAGLASFALGNPDNSHVTFLFAMFLNYYFLRLEARRFRTFEIAHHRVRIMERFFYPAMLGDAVDPGWHQLLLAELGKPRSPMSRADALGWRLNRNYLWIYAAVLFAWFAKLDLSQPKGWVLEFPEALSLADIGNFPGWLVFVGVIVFYGYLIVLAVRAARTYPLEEG
ncbi:DUF2270 domain-containing protein [Deinococcus planocerae]|uniref:DUF2270 domain-containing protein n=1 Tax=Deinococcus planocerae TaxID=1737569 RepID=UPI000C7E8B68|nr:DUF2270 domain-containing protein [Deinococcus planocerae]